MKIQSAQAQLPAEDAFYILILIAPLKYFFVYTTVSIHNH